MGAARSIFVRFLIPLLVFVAACGSANAVVDVDDDTTVADQIELSLSLYVVDEADGGTGSARSSQRSVAAVEQIVERMQTIWDQAGIVFVISTITRIEAPTEVLSDLGRGETATFLDGVYRGIIKVPDAGTINGFYVRSLGRINGMAPLGTRTFFVTDEPSVHDERVSSHEIGHILGLHHTTDDSGRLMFSGTNGMEFSEAEIATARYTAEGIIDGNR
ncbi:MAG: hypothetical protein ACC683_08920 [Acidimicrobiia bacterium]